MADRHGDGHRGEGSHDGVRPRDGFEVIDGQDHEGQDHEAKPMPRVVDDLEVNPDEVMGVVTHRLATAVGSKLPKSLQRRAKLFRKWMTPEEFEYLMLKQGLRWRLGEFYEHLAADGLAMHKNLFLMRLQEILESFLVKGDSRLAPTQMEKVSDKWWEQ